VRRVQWLVVVRDGIAQYWTARTDGTWHLVVVGVVSVFSMNCLSGLVVL
jgi:hypothetical protein